MNMPILERTGVHERDRPMLELELVQFRQSLRAWESPGLSLFLELQFLAERIAPASQGRALSGMAQNLSLVMPLTPSKATALLLWRMICAAGISD